MRYGVIDGGPTKTAIETVTVFSRQFPGINSHAVRLSPTDGSNSRHVYPEAYAEYSDPAPKQAPRSRRLPFRPLFTRL